MTIAHLPTPFEQVFAVVDEQGNTVATPRATCTLAQVTPLAAMELYEQLHAARNELRRQHGQAELATPDAALLILAFLRREAEQPAEGLRGLLEHFDAAAKQIQVARLEEVTENGREFRGTLIPPTDEALQAVRDREE
jgi:hypothetical protein